jgi:hypothetical protein
MAENWLADSGQTTNHPRLCMNEKPETSVNRDGLLESFAADLTVAAYRVALRTRTNGTWLDLELDLWRELADTVNSWGSEWSMVPIAGDPAYARERR